VCGSIVVAVSFLAQSPLSAQTAAVLAAVSGQVVTSQGTPIADARLLFAGRNGFTTVASGTDGTFRLAIAPDDYHLTVSATGFRPVTRSVVVGHAPLALNIQLASLSESLIEIGRVGVNSAPALSTSSNVVVELNPQNAAQRGVEHVGDILAEQIGLTAVRPSGGAATLPLVVALRGPDPSETLVDIDGHQVNNSNTGDFDLSLLDPNDLSGIELLYGIAPSSLIGPNTIGGAINLRTLEPTAQAHALVRSSAGSFNTFGTTLQATGTRGRLGYAVSVHRYSSQGELHDRTVPVANDTDALNAVPLSSGTTAASVLAKVRYAMLNGAFAQLSLRDQSSNRDQSAALSVENPDGTFTAFPGASVAAHDSAYGLDFYAPIGQLSASGSRSATLLLRHYVSVSNQSVNGPIADNGSAYFFNNRDFVTEDSLEYNRSFSRSALTLKADIRTERLTEPFASLSSGGVIEQSPAQRAPRISDGSAATPPSGPLTESDVQRSFAARYTVDAWRNVQLTLAAYYSNFSTFGTALDPRLGLTWTPTRRSVVRASLGTTFQPPQLSQLFVPSPLPTPPPNGFVLIGNPKLIADRATEYQLGYEHLFGSEAAATRVSLDLYRTNLRTPIQEFISDSGYAYPINIGGAVYRGFELRVERNLGRRLHMSAGYSTNSTYPTAVPPSIGNGSLVAGQQFLGVPLHRANLALSGEAGHGVSFDLGTAYEGANNELNRPAFATVRASISARHGPLIFTLSGTNITNVYADGFTRDGVGIPYSGLVGPIATPALALPAAQIIFSVTRTY